MNKAILKTQWLGMAKVPFAVPQWGAVGPLLYSITQRPHGDFCCLMTHPQEPLKALLSRGKLAEDSCP